MEPGRICIAQLTVRRRTNIELAIVHRKKGRPPPEKMVVRDYIIERRVCAKLKTDNGGRILKILASDGLKKTEEDNKVLLSSAFIEVSNREIFHCVVTYTSPRVKLSEYANE